MLEADKKNATRWRELSGILRGYFGREIGDLGLLYETLRRVQRLSSPDHEKQWQCDLIAAFAAFREDTLADLAHKAVRDRNHYLAGVVADLMSRVDPQDRAGINDATHQRLIKLAK